MCVSPLTSGQCCRYDRLQMLSAAFTDTRFPVPASAVPGLGASIAAASVKREPRETDSDEEIEVGKESDMEEDRGSRSPAPVQDQPEDLSVKKPTSVSSASSSRPSSISPPTRSSDSGSPDSQKTGSDSTGRSAKRIKPIPPPLDLNARTLSPHDSLPGPASLLSPAADTQQRDTQLPLRKR